MARFYGWNEGEIYQLSYKQFQKYILAIDVLRARELMELIDVSSYPHLNKKESQRRLFNELKKRANNVKHINNSGLNISPQEAAEIMARRMLEVKNRG